MNPVSPMKKTRSAAQSTCRRCGAERPAWLGTAHKCVGDADVSWLSYHKMDAQTAAAWRRHILAVGDDGYDGYAAYENGSGAVTPLAG